METYLENCFIADYREGYVSSVIDVCKPQPSPLRGWGRKSFYLGMVKPVQVNSFQFKALGTLKGMGRLENFYTKLYEFILSNGPKDRATVNNNYHYWRGAGKP